MERSFDGHGHGHATAWSDAPTRASLEVVAESAALLSGFRYAVISVRRGESLEAVATSSPELAHLIGSTLPVEALERELERADAWDDLRFVPHDRVGDEVLRYSFVPDLEQAPGQDAWHALDLLAAPIYDDHGALRGLLTVDIPVGGQRPGAAQREVLGRYARVTRTSVLMALERECLEQRVQLLTEVRELVRHALAEPSLDLVIEACRSAIVQAFDAVGMWLSVLDSHGDLTSTWYSERGYPRPRFELLGDRAVRLAHAYWAQQYVAHFSHSRAEHPNLSTDEAKFLLDFLDGIDIGSVLFVPLGAGADCLGYLVISRVFDEPPWTAVERDVALEIGHDLGRAVANARQLEKERALVAGLRELDTYRTEMINTVAHELRSPLTSIMGNVEMLDFEDDLSAPGRRSVEAALRGVRRIEGVIDDLLTVARFSDPLAAFDPVCVDLCDVVRDVADECAHAATAESIDLTVEVPADAVHVWGRADELHRVVANLTVNAIKYSDEQSTVVVSIARQGADVALSVVDHGLGISEVDQANLFREFQRSSNPEALRRPGTGLGLVIVERIVRRHHGDIRLTSELGRGTTVTVTLPAGLEP